MTAEPKKSVSLRKGDPDPPPPSSSQPRTVLYAVGALVLCGVSALVAAVDLYLPSVKDWLRHERNKNIHDDYTSALKDAGSDPAKIKTAQTDLNDKINSLGHDVTATQKGLLISVLVALVVLGFIAYATYRGRYWSRWGVLGLWFLASFTGTIIGIQSALAVAADIPALYKVPAFLAAVLLIAAVLLVNLRPSVEYFASNRPVVPAGRSGAGRPRRGLFAPPPPRPDRAGTRTAEKKAAATRPAATTDRSRSKQRANNAAVAKGAELARTRAKAASKSRRTES